MEARLAVPGLRAGYVRWRRAVAIGCAMLLSGCAGTAAAGDAAAGERKSRACHACHGADGISINDLWPNLGGQKRGYLEKQIKAFRDGQRRDPLMQPLVRDLSDEDIADIAAYYSGLSGEPAPPPGH